MGKFGNVFRNIRLAKKLSLKDIAEGSISISFLSKFERGESDISLTNFYSLIDKMSITIEEFSYIANDYRMLDFESLLDKIKNAYESNNIPLLLRYKEQELELSIDSRINLHKLNSIMISALIYNLDNSRGVPQKDKDYLSEYLLSIDNWGYYEIVLFGNSMGALTLQSIIVLSKEILKKSRLYLKLKSNRNEIIRIMLNSITYCLEGDKYTDSLYFIKTLEDILENSVLYFERTKLIFLIGIYKIKTGNKEAGISNCRKAVQIMNDMGSIELAVNHKNYLEVLLEKLGFSNMTKN